MSAKLVLGLLLAAIHLDFTVAEIGVAFGINGNNLLRPSRVVELYKQYGIQRMRIYEPCEATLVALHGTNIELTMSVLNAELPNMASSQTNANAWVKKYITDYTPGVNFKTIVVGNEITPTSENHQFVLQAMRNVINALSSAGLQIKVTTSIATDIVEGYPPEKGKFRDNAVAYITPIINLVVKNDAPLFANLFPYFAKIGKDGKYIDLDYALLDPSYPGVKAEGSNYTYQNLYYALHDTVYTAVGKIVASCPDLTDAAGNNNHNLHGGESGWPKKRSRRHKVAGVDNDDDDVANVENARRYVNNLIQVVKNGTPLRPGRPIPTFIFSMFDENLKPGGEEERNFGIFLPNGTPSYPVNFK